MGLKDPERRREYNRRWRKKQQPEKMRLYLRAWNLFKNYGIRQAQYDAILAAQGGRCALFEVCGSSTPGAGDKYWCVDHDHETGRVRGLLCHRCNISRVGVNDIQSAAAVLHYLEMHQPEPGRIMVLPAKKGEGTPPNPAGRESTPEPIKTGRVA